MRTTFAVGRLTPKSAEIVVLEGSREPSPVRGPFTLQALVRRLEEVRGPRPAPGAPTTVH